MYKEDFIVLIHTYYLGERCYGGTLKMSIEIVISNTKFTFLCNTPKSMQSAIQIMRWISDGYSWQTFGVYFDLSPNISEPVPRGRSAQHYPKSFGIVWSLPK